MVKNSFLPYTLPLFTHGLNGKTRPFRTAQYLVQVLRALAMPTEGVVLANAHTAGLIELLLSCWLQTGTSRLLLPLAAAAANGAQLWTPGISRPM